MKVNFIIPKEEGAPVGIKGELSSQEANFLLEFAFLYFLQRGFVPDSLADAVTELAQVDKKDLH